jgi:hypothetical protein
MGYGFVNHLLVQKFENVEISALKPESIYFYGNH